MVPRCCLPLVHRHAFALMTSAGNNKRSLAPAFEHLEDEVQDEMYGAWWGAIRRYAGCSAGSSAAAVLGSAGPRVAEAVVAPVLALAQALQLSPDEALGRLSVGELSALSEVSAVRELFVKQTGQDHFEERLWRCTTCHSLRSKGKRAGKHGEVCGSCANKNAVKKD